MARWLKACAFIMLASATAFAGDIANFENLGFSDDSRTFAFAQYGVEDESSAAYADLFVVDVAGNNFVRNGQYSRQFETALVPGQNGRGALYRVLFEAQSTLAGRSVNHLNVGRPIYILIDGEEPKSSLAFRDFASNTRYVVDLHQSSRGSGTEVRGSFHVELTLTDGDGDTISRTIGRPGYFREGVASYRILQILLSPDEKSIVFVMEKRLATDNGFDVRYMVETASLQ